METTDHDLLIRIDERQTAIFESLSTMEKKINCAVVNDDDFKLLVSRTNTMWDNQNKFIGLVLGIGGIAGGVAGTIATIVKTALAR